ncbi:hypothetical protein JCM8208_005660 [Rhodotorula glutinis]
MSLFNLLPNPLALTALPFHPLPSTRDDTLAPSSHHVEGLSFDEAFDYDNYVAGEAARMPLGQHVGLVSLAYTVDELYHGAVATAQSASALIQKSLEDILGITDDVPSSLDLLPADSPTSTTSTPPTSPEDLIMVDARKAAEPASARPIKALPAKVKSAGAPSSSSKVVALGAAALITPTKVGKRPAYALDESPAGSSAKKARVAARTLRLFDQEVPPSPSRKAASSASRRARPTSPSPTTTPMTTIAAKAPRYTPPAPPAAARTTTTTTTAAAASSAAEGDLSRSSSYESGLSLLSSCGSTSTSATSASARSSSTTGALPHAHLAHLLTEHLSTSTSTRPTGPANAGAAYYDWSSRFGAQQAAAWTPSGYLPHPTSPSPLFQRSASASPPPSPLARLAPRKGSLRDILN